MSGLRNDSVTVLLLLAVVAITWADFATGQRVVFSVVYLLPIILGAWLLPGWRATTVSILATSAWLLGDVAWRGVGEPAWVRVWNASAGVVTLSTMAALVLRARHAHEAVLAANRQLDLALALEAEAARTDALTGLPNVRAFSEQLARDVARSRRARTPVSLLYVDLDDFKRVNDLYSHAAGDDLLRRTGSRLGTVLRAGDIAARIGGDEFVVLLVDSSAAAAKEVAARIVQMVREEAHEFPDAGVSASVGVTHYVRVPDRGAGEMLSRADAAMYRAKQAGKSRVFVDVV